MSFLSRMEGRDDNGGEPLSQPAAEERSPGSQQPEVRCRRRRRVASVSCPALSASRLTLPGVMDSEGRVDESRLRMHIFKNGGVCPSERGLAWRFLFGMYPCSSTALERSLLCEQLLVRYLVMRRKWQQFLPSAVRIQLNGTDAELVSAVRYFDQREAQAQQQTQDQSEEVRDRLAFLELQAQAWEQFGVLPRRAGRHDCSSLLKLLPHISTPEQSVDLSSTSVFSYHQLLGRFIQILFERVTFDQEELREAIRIIDKDVPRTNRDLGYYQDKGLGNLLVLRNVLITYAAFHPEVSYAQGMNDLCSRFLEVLDSEADAFWSFSCYMEKFSRDFRADGLHRKIELEAALLKELDPPLYTHLVKDNMESFTFCHRWLLLGFQREFEHSDALRLFEILSCDHLELISQQVDRARYQERLGQKYCTENRSKSELPAFNTDFTFELFICAAILLDNRETLLRCHDDVQLIQFTSSLQGSLDLNDTLKKAENHFYNYCKRCAWDYVTEHCRASSRQEDFFYQLRSLFVLK